MTRVTHMSALFKENVSLSLDRSRIAFHGATDKDDYASYEIYVIDVDGTNLVQLTDNSILDGHPGWSPDDSRIIYASFRDTGKASIVIMDTDGNEILDLTPAGADDNDPDYLPDGRIVFKTDRFSTAPQVGNAVMDADGSGVIQLTKISLFLNALTREPTMPSMLKCLLRPGTSSRRGLTAAVSKHCWQTAGSTGFRYTTQADNTFVT